MTVEGVVVTPLARIQGDQGDVLHALKSTDAQFHGFGEAYFSTIAPRAVKSWRKHLVATLNLVVPVGQVRFVFLDDRGDWVATHEIGEGNYARLTVPPGVWFAFQGTGPGTSLILSISDRAHDPAESVRSELEAFPFQWSGQEER